MIKLQHTRTALDLIFIYHLLLKYCQKIKMLKSIYGFLVIVTLRTH